MVDRGYTCVGAEDDNERERILAYIKYRQELAMQEQQESKQSFAVSPLVLMSAAF